MLRHAVSESFRRYSRSIVSKSQRRCYAAATSKQKRALNKAQLEGAGGTTKAKAGTTTTPPPTTPSPPPPPSAGGGGGDGSGALIGVGALAAAGGAAYYFDVFGLQQQLQPTPTPTKEEAVVEEQKPIVVEEEKKEEEVAAAPAVEEEEKVETPTTTEESEKQEGGEETKPEEEQAAATEEAAVQETASSSTPEEEAQPVEAAVEAQPVVEEITVTEPATTSSKLKSVEENIAELSQTSELEASETIKRAQRAISDSFDVTLFEDLDDLSPAQLKARVAQLATEMKERTKWEAVRLKEFLAMKERETADKYLEVLQKQRHDFEDVLAAKLREQQNQLISETNRILQEKDDSIASQVQSALEVQQKQLESDREAAIKHASDGVASKCEQEYLKELEKYKKDMSSKMKRRNDKIEKLDKRLKELKAALENTQAFQSGSMKAHRVSAAALALAEKLETNEGAAQELAALQLAVGEDGVVAAALSTIPASRVKAGIPTLAELRARFDSVQRKTRQAALVPEGLGGSVEGQLLGMMFSAVRFPPTLDDDNATATLPTKDSDLAEYRLVRARQHVELGELEGAVEQLSHLKGQAAFTVEDWKDDAQVRIAIDKALKVIKMEAALLNEDMSNPQQQK